MNLDYVSPFGSALDCTNQSGADSVIPCYFTMKPIIDSDFRDITLGQFRKGSMASFRRTVAGDHISRVICYGPPSQMRWVKAGRVVTGVEGVASFFRRHIPAQLQSNRMNQIRCSRVNPDHAVSVTVALIGPLPALIGWRTVADLILKPTPRFPCRGFANDKGRAVLFNSPPMLGAIAVRVNSIRAIFDGAYTFGHRFLLVRNRSGRERLRAARPLYSSLLADALA